MGVEIVNKDEIDKLLAKIGRSNWLGRLFKRIGEHLRLVLKNAFPGGARTATASDGAPQYEEYEEGEPRILSEEERTESLFAEIDTVKVPFLN